MRTDPHGLLRRVCAKPYTARAIFQECLTISDAALILASRVIEYVHDVADSLEASTNVAICTIYIPSGSLESVLENPELDLGREG